MDHLGVALVAFLVVVWSAVGRRLDHAPLTGPMVFLLAGLALGPDALGVLAVDVESTVVHTLAEATLVVVLFTDAARLDLSRLRGEAGLPARMLGVGLPLTILAGAGAVALTVDELSGWSIVLLGAVLAPTDAALGQAVVSDRSVPVRIRQSLNVESGLNDGLALPVVTLLAAAAGGDFVGPGSAAAFFAQQVGGGVLTGVLLGWAGARVVGRAADAGWMSANAQQIATLACGAAAWGVASSLGGNGFVAAFTAGLAFGAVANEHAGRMAEFAEEEGELLTLVTFLLVGAALVGPAIAAADPARWLLVLLALTVVRMVPTSVSLLGTGLAWPSHLFLGWFGPRGLATVVFGVLVVEQGGVPGADVVLEVASLAVFVSAVAHGITAAPLADRYGTWTRRRPEGASEHVAMPELHPRRWMRDGRARLDASTGDRGGLST